MSAVLPDRVPLEMPEEDPAALAEATAAVSGAAFRLGVLEAHLAGRAATAPGWLGRDAGAAATRIGAVAGLARELHGALSEALHRLDRHADLLVRVRARIAVLRAQQQEDYDVATARLARLLSAATLPAPASGPSPVVVLRDDLGAAEAVRRREHAALLDELRSDAVATAHALGAATAVVGGTGTRGERSRVIAHLAAALPGWGEGELAARGTALARGVLGASSLRALEQGALEAECYAGTRAFADALLAALGPAGFREVLFVLADEALGPDSPWAAVLAMALRAAAPTGAPADPVADVLGAGYVDPTDRGTIDDFVAVGMAAVLAAGAALRYGGVPPTTVARWGLQVLRREQALRGPAPMAYRAVDRTGPGSAQRLDPVAEVLRLLSEEDDPDASALLLSDRRSWEALLGRPIATYPDAGARLREVVRQAVTRSGPHGKTAVRGGLQALGTGLADGDPGHWRADRTTAAALAVPLAEGIAAHSSAATDVLLRAGDGAHLDPAEDAALRGVGVVSIDPHGSAAIQRALAQWAVDRAAAAPEGLVPAATAVGGYVAVREYGQRLAYALHGVELRDAARARADLYDWTLGLLQFLPGVAGGVAGLVSPFAAHALGADGTWRNGPDVGPVFGAGDAAAAAEVGLAPDGADPAAVGARARSAFLRVGGGLGLPLPPQSPVWRWEDAARDAVPIPGAGRFHVEMPGGRELLERLVGATGHPGAG